MVCYYFREDTYALYLWSVDTNRPYLHHQQTISILLTDHIYTTNRPYLHHQQTISAPPTDHICTTNRPYLHHQQTISYSCYAEVVNFILPPLRKKKTFMGNNSVPLLKHFCRIFDLAYAHF
jgi:hypothetical protein